MGVHEAKAAAISSYDAHADRYVHQRHTQARSGELLLDRLRNEQHLLPDGDWLDVACGTGDLFQSIHFDGRSGRRVGIDLSASMIDIARERYGDIAEFQVADATQLPFADNSFRIVTSNIALHWLNNPEHGLSIRPALEEIQRVLIDDGYYGLSMVAAGGAGQFSRHYRQVYNDHPQWRDETVPFRPQPIGGIELPYLVDELHRTGLKISTASSHYEPAMFATTAEYLEGKRTIGYGSYMTAFTPERREEAWKTIIASFCQEYGQGEFTLNRYILYAAGRK